jgi:hypothetical protein
MLLPVDDLVSVLVQVAEAMKVASAGRSSLAGSVHEALLSFVIPKPSTEGRDRCLESEARPDCVDAKESREECWLPLSSKKLTSPTAELTMRMRPAFFSKTMKRLSWGSSTVVVSDDGRCRMPRVSLGCNVDREQ